MKIEEKLQIETGENIYLYKEGVFWTAYNLSAYMLVQLKNLRPAKKYIKSVKQEVVSVGFPSSVLSFFTEQLGVPLKQADTQIVLNKLQGFDTLLFDQWKDSLESSTGNDQTVNQRNKLTTIPVADPVNEQILHEKNYRP